MTTSTFIAATLVLLNATIAVVATVAFFYLRRQYSQLLDAYQSERKRCAAERRQYDELLKNYNRYTAAFTYSARSSAFHIDVDPRNDEVWQIRDDNTGELLAEFECDDDSMEWLENTIYALEAKINTLEASLDDAGDLMPGEGTV